MKIFLKIISAIIILLSFTCRALACTSFVVYGDKIYYGMNWDYPEVNSYLRIEDYDGYLKVFNIGFDTEYGSATNASMNEDGFFTAVQDLLPDTGPTADIEDQDIEDMHDIARWTPFMEDSVSSIRGILDSNHAASKYYSMHTLFADSSGDAMVLEEINGENIKTDISGSYIVMTNFANSLLREKSIDELRTLEFQGLSSFGAERYYKAWSYLEEHKDSFSVEKGFELLSETAQYGYYSTQYSAVYCPETTEVFIALQGNYDHIWKVSLADKTIETYQGFHNHISYPLDEKGITISQLVEYEKEDSIQVSDKNTNYTIYIAAALLLAGMAFLLIYRRKQIKQA